MVSANVLPFLNLGVLCDYEMHLVEMLVGSNLATFSFQSVQVVYMHQCMNTCFTFLNITMLLN